MTIGSMILLVVAISLMMLLLWLNRIGKKYNQVNWGSSFLNKLDGIFRYYCLNFHRLKFKSVDGVSKGFNLPKEGGALLICNHMSGIDPFMLVSSCNRPIRFIIAKEEYERWYLKWMFKGAGCIPVDRTGRADIAFRQAKRALDNGEIIALFPHGRIHLDQEQPYRVKGGIKKMSEFTKVPVFVARLTGIKPEGGLFMPLFVRSNTVITQFPNLSYEYFSEEDSLLRLGELLLGHRSEL